MSPSVIKTRGFQLLLLTIAMATAGYVRTAVSPLQEAIRVTLSLSDNEVAMLQGPVIGVPAILAAIPLGLLVDRTSRARLLFILILLSFLGSALTALSPGFGVLLIARGLAGVSALGIVPVVFSLLADLYPAEERGSVSTAVIVGQSMGNSSAFALGGALLAATDHAVGWRWAMTWLVVPVALITFLMLAVREPPRSGSIVARPSLREVWRELHQYREIAGLLASGIVLTETALGATLIWSAPMMARRLDLPPDRIGALMAVGIVVSGILGPVIGGFIADRCYRTGGPRRTMTVLSIVSILSAPAGLFAVAPGVVATTGLMVTTIAAILAVAVMGMALFTIVMPNELRGLCMSMLMAAILFFALAVAPVTVSMLSGVLGGTAAIGQALTIVCVTAFVLAAGAFALGRRYVPAGRPG